MRLETFNEIVCVLNKYKVKYLVVGGVAVVAHGYGRLTYDLDLVIQLSQENILAGFAALETLKYYPSVPVTCGQFSNQEIRNGWVREKGMTVLNFFSEKYSDTPVDIFVSEPFDFDDCFKNSIMEEVSPGNKFRFVAIPTLIAMKLVAGRDKDKDDIEHLKIIQAEIENESK